MNKEVKFSTLGCRLNTYETEAMKHLVQKANLKNTIVVNTCAVTNTAVSKSKKEIRRLRRKYPSAKLVVTGCAAQIDPKNFSDMIEVDHVIGNTEKMLSKTWIDFSDSAKPDKNRIQVDDIMSIEQVAGHLIDGFGTRSRAYVQIQNGCDHRCTFCTIPYGRGNSRSVPAGAVVEQIKRLIQKGFNEIVLTGVDLTSWGADLPSHPALSNLIKRILLLVPDLKRLRLSSIDSIELDEEFFEIIASEPRLMPHLHLSLQHGDNLILKRMKRRHLREDAIEFCNKVRTLRPDVIFGADIIIGFPTETQKHFENSIKMVKECGITWLHVFPFSKREGTPAAKMPQVDKKVKKSRVNEFKSVSEQAVQSHLQAQVGKIQRVLIEDAKMGRTEQFSEVRFECPKELGKIVSTEIKGVSGDQLIAL